MTKKFKNTLSAIFSTTIAVIPIATTLTITSCSTIDSYPKYNANLLFDNLVEFISANPDRMYNTDGEKQAADWIANKLLSFGYDKKDDIITKADPSNEIVARDDRAFFKQEGVSIQEFSYQRVRYNDGIFDGEYADAGTPYGPVWNSQNVLLSIPTNNATINTKNIIITSHYDSIDTNTPLIDWSERKSQGVGDSASGVVAMITLAQFFAEHGNNTKYNIQLLFCGAEETGANGSAAFSQQFLGYYEKYQRRNWNVWPRAVQLYGTINVNAFEYCLNIDTLLSGDYIYSCSPWKEVKQPWDGQIIENEITYSDENGNPMEDYESVVGNKEISDAVIKMSKKTKVDNQFKYSNCESLWDVNLEVLTYSKEQSNGNRFHRQNERTDASDHYAFYVVGIKTANIGAANNFIATPGLDGGFDGRTQTSNSLVWDYPLRTITPSESGLKFNIYESTNPVEETLKGAIWHSWFDRLDSLAEVFGLEVIRQQFFGAFKGVFELLLSFK